MKNEKARLPGSITVFMSLMLMVVASLLFTLVEGSRYMMLGMAALLNSQSVTESMFAEYNVPAYENYHLFMMDSSYGTGQIDLSKIHARMQELGQENLNPIVSGFGRFSNFLQMNVTDSSVVSYELATDNQEGALLRQMAQVIKKEMAADIIQQAYQKVAGIQESENKGKQADGYLDGALETLEQAKEAVQDTDGIKQQSMQKAQLKTDRADMALIRQFSTGIRSLSQQLEPQQNESPVLSGDDMQDMPDNPMEDVKKAKSSPLLSQILSDGDKISAKAIAKEDALEYRTLNIGNYETAGSTGAIDKLLITQYLKKYTTHYRKKTSIPHALAYEQEYILFGKYSDEENLKKMARRMLLLREGINFTYLLSDSAKREEALAMATSLTIFAGIPAAATAIQMGILASWAYAESIVELRTLFSGGKIAALKTASSWTVSLPETAVVLFQNSVKAKEVSGGLKYEDYLQAFLLAESTDKIGVRFADLLEKNLRLYTGYETVKLDCMITAMETDHAYHAQQVFISFVTITHLSKKGYRYKETYDFSYLKQRDDS